jgi:hypothetical protein
MRPAVDGVPMNFALALTTGIGIDQMAGRAQPHALINRKHELLARAEAADSTALRDNGGFSFGRFTHWLTPLCASDARAPRVQR